ncbi:MAG: class I SAM-dependent methyltransferase [Candidatus Iainarchaeum archaeon]|uniref:Class I SAM-dependent methyltransferase n=1 Tax=Candidatus Iainarchaeum sp. TaxID=3101447 RepID=A0A7T9DJ49_9ARCH|nr:MAG: class I SAM-dependent methyltransferase [Candidatus Diapherotrites archaeon]
MPAAPTDIIAEFYERYPYPLLSNLSRKHLETYADQLLACADLTTRQLEGKTILDGGCGTGEITCSMATHAKKVIGIDLSSTSITHAQSLAKKYALENITFIQQDILQLRMKEKFDLVTSFGVLHHTQNPTKGFEIISQRVKKNGILIIGFYHSLGGWKQRLQKWIVGMLAGKDPQKRLAFIEQFLGKKLGPHQRAFWMDRIANPRERYHSIPAMKRMFERNGFEIIGIQAHKPAFSIKDIANPLDVFLFESFLFVKGFRFAIIAGKNQNKRV